MADKPHFKPDQIAKALIDAKGRRYLAAQNLKCSGQTIYNYIKRYPELQELVDDLKGRRVDAAEDGLDEAVAKGQPWAIALTLRTLGRDRGYSERTDHRHQFEGPLEVQIVTYGEENEGEDSHKERA